MVHANSLARKLPTPCFEFAWTIRDGLKHWEWNQHEVHGIPLHNQWLWRQPPSSSIDTKFLRSWSLYRSIWPCGILLLVHIYSLGFYGIRSTKVLQMDQSSLVSKSLPYIFCYLILCCEFSWSNRLRESRLMGSCWWVRNWNFRRISNMWVARSGSQKQRTFSNSVQELGRLWKPCWMW